jgi:hypothetical protein
VRDKQGAPNSDDGKTLQANPERSKSAERGRKVAEHRESAERRKNAERTDVEERRFSTA